MGQILKNVTSGKLNRPFRVLLYGKGGIGKTTWASQAPKPIFLGEHGGSDELDVPRLPKVETWAQAMSSIEELQNDEHDYQSLVIDTLDWFEPILWRATCARGMSGRTYSSLSEWGYGKGEKAALDDWRVLLSKLEALEDKRNMNVILLAHSHIKTFQNPDGDPYDRMELKLEKQAAALFLEWPKAVLFATFETYTKKDNKNDRKAKAYGEGARIVHTQPRPTWDAKSRYPLPARMALSWSDFANAARGLPESSPTDLNGQIEKLLSEVDEITRTQGTAALGRCGSDPEKLAKLLEWLRGKVLTAA